MAQNMAVLVQFLLLFFVVVTATTAAAGDENRPLATSASIARRGLDMKCTCTTCQNPCDDYPTPPTIYDSPPPVVYYSPPPPPVEYYSPPPPESIYYYSPPPPSTPYCPPPPSQPICGGCGGSTGGGSGYSPYVSWFSPPGQLYPQDPGYHPGAASRGKVAWWLSVIIGGLMVLWW